MHPSGRNLACSIVALFFQIVFPLNLSECDCFTGILISHYLIAGITLKIRSQHWSKIWNGTFRIETCNSYIRFFSQNHQDSFCNFKLIHQEGKKLN